MIEQNIVSQPKFWYEIWSWCYKIMVNINVIFLEILKELRVVNVWKSTDNKTHPLKLEMANINDHTYWLSKVLLKHMPHI